jgi:hypothetical protein
LKFTARHRKSQIRVGLELARNAGTLISVSVRAKDQLHLHLPLNFGATQRQRSKNKKGDQRRLFLVAGARNFILLITRFLWPFDKTTEKF